MLSFQNFLIESDGKLVHLEHLEELMYDTGISGARDAIHFLLSLRDNLAGHSSKHTINLTSKVDGAPSLVAGINPENGKFFVASKSIFNKNPKLNYTNQDIEKNHGSGGLAEKLRLALKYLPEIWTDGIYQGDMMFTKSDLKSETIEGQEYVTFQPNTIVYAVPSDSGLARVIRSAQVGVVWHTKYSGRTIESLQSSHNINLGSFRQSKNVWFRDASFVDLSGTVTLTLEETRLLTNILSRAGSTLQSISGRTLGEISASNTKKITIKAWNNSHVRAGQRITNTSEHTKGLIQSISSKYDISIASAKKPETRLKRQREKELDLRWYRQNMNQLKLIFDLQNLITEAKIMVIRKLEGMKQVTQTFIRDKDGLKFTTPEGFVASDIIKGKTVKLVDRLTFSHNNFNTVKNWISE